LAFNVILCYRCGQLILARSDQKTRLCPYCKTKLLTSKAKKVASARNAREASVLLRSLRKRHSTRPAKQLKLDSKLK